MTNLIFQLNDIGTFSFAMRTFFVQPVTFIYKFIEYMLIYMTRLAGLNFGLDEMANKISETIFVTLLVFMVFKVTVSFLTYLIKPDTVSDKETGFSKLIQRIVIAIVLLISINPFFTLLGNVQEEIMQGNLIDRFIFGENVRYIKNDTKNRKLYSIKMDELCPENYRLYALTKEQAFAIYSLKPFYQLNDYTTYLSDDNEDSIVEKVVSHTKSVNGVVDIATLPTDVINDIRLDSLGSKLKEKVDEGANGYCGIDLATITDETNPDKIYSKILRTPNTTWELLFPTRSLNYADAEGKIAEIIKAAFATTTAGISDGLLSQYGEQAYVIDFNYVFAFIFGIVILLLILSICFDIVVRAFTLFLYKILAPIPIISYMSPNKKDTEKLSVWFKKTVSCWASLFLRLIVLNIVIYSVDIILSNDEIINLGRNGFVLQIIIIIGALIFAKKAPKLIEELFPGLKLEGFKLNPLKRIKDEALGGSAVAGGLVGAGAAALTGAAQGASNAMALGMERNNLKKQIALEKDPEKRAKLENRLKNLNGTRAAQTVLGGIAGGARRGAVSGYNTGKTGSGNITKGLANDLKAGNTARNNRTAIRNFNKDVDYDEQQKLAALEAQKDSMTPEEYNSKVDSIREDAKEQRYTWFDRNIVENVNRIAGVKNEFGGYGYYSEKIEDLTKEIDNMHQSEMAMRQALANKVAESNVGYDKLEELRSKMAKPYEITNARGESVKVSFDFNADIKSTVDSFDVSTGDVTFSSTATETFKNDFKHLQSTAYDMAVKQVGAEASEEDKNKLAKEIMQAYCDNQSSLAGITSLDNNQKTKKTERRSYQDMMEAKGNVKKN